MDPSVGWDAIADMQGWLQRCHLSQIIVIFYFPMVNARFGLLLLFDSIEFGAVYTLENQQNINRERERERERKMVS